MLSNFFIIVLLLVSFICKSFCTKGFTIETEGKNVVTTKITNQDKFSAIALTEAGTLFKYNSSSSIVSTTNFHTQLSTGYSSSSFICQYETNKVVLTRDKKIFEITLDSNEADTIIQKTPESPENIVYLHCNSNKYIYTYLTESSKKYNAKTSDNKIIIGTTQSNTILSASCFLADSSLALCTYIIKGQTKLSYSYHSLDSSSTATTREIPFSNIYEIKGALIKYYSNNEILLCLSTKPLEISDIFLNCSMLNANINSNPKTLDIKSTGTPRFPAINKITDEIKYCQIERLTDSNVYASICLSYYYRTTYILSIFKFNNNRFDFYTKGINEFQDLSFPLLMKSQISIISFRENNLGIFYQDIDTDSMIIVFYPNCGINFDQVPKENDNINCYDLSIPITNYYYDECTHSFLKIPTGYSKYERSQICKIKKIECNNAGGYVLDKVINGYPVCRNKNQPPDHFYFDSASNKFKKCFRSCLKCNGPEIDQNNHNCQECDEANGFYSFTFNSLNQCLHKDVPIEGYCFDSSFKECNEGCLTCVERPSDLTDTKCTKCKIDEDYWPQIDKPSNCMHKDRNDVAYYYPNEHYKRWEKCTEGCKYCKTYGDSIDNTNCDTSKVNDYCDTDKGYYPVESDDDTTINPNCFKEDVRHDHYYFDNEDKIFKKCNKACLQCDTWGNITNDFYNTSCLENKCDEKNNYFPNEDRPTICYKYNTYPPYYYFDPNTKKFKRCHEACSQCKEQIDVNENDTQCHSCSWNYYPLAETFDSQDEKNCYHRNRVGYYYKDYKMHKCPEKCTKCEFVDSLGDAYCTECNNELGFYQNDTYEKYIECFTWRKEKLDSDPHYNHHPPLNTLLIGNIFVTCNPACSICTSIDMSQFSPHCQAKKCNPGYIYVQNNEDICFKSNLEFPLHYKYYDQVLDETYFKPCYHTCKTCSAEGNKRTNNCLYCREGFIWHPNNITNINNCIFDCLTLPNMNYYYLDEDKNDEYICVEKCPEEYPYLQPEKKRCLKTCSTEQVLKYSKDRICVAACPEGTTDNVKSECVSVSNECIKSDLESTLILNDINDTNINTLIVDYCHDYSYTTNQVNHFTNKLNEYNIYLYKNRKCIDEFDINFPDLSVCFDDLKNNYEISQNQDLIVMIMNIKRNDSYIRVEYKVFDSITCEELNLGNCTAKNIFTNINMERYFEESEIRKSKVMYLDKDINVYDREHPFFTDICYQFDYEGDKDMILEDRVNWYYQDISDVCEKKCKPKADFDKRIIKCGCDIKEKFMVEESDEDKKQWGFGVGGISVEVLKCSGKAFQWKHFKTNIGSYSALVLIVAEFPVIIYFIVVGLSKVKIFLIPFMGANPPKNKSIKNNDNNSEKENSSKSDANSIQEKKSVSEINSNNISNELDKNDIVNKIKTVKTNSSKKIATSSSQISNIRLSKEFNDKNSDDTLIKRDLNDSNQEYVKKKFDIYKDIIDLEDLNDVELYDATNLDKRTFCQFYYQELKNTQPIIYSFIYYTPLTPRFFKFLQFIFNTTFCFVANAFFYSKFYISEKCFYFENSFHFYFTQIYDRIIYTCLSTIIISLILRVLTSSKKKMIMWIKREKDPEVFNKEITYMMKRMKINYIIYSSVQGSFMFLFWLYLSCFCIAYKNNEMEWFVTSWICFGIIQIWYFISTFIVTCLRFLGIKCGMESCYNVSLFLAFD